MCTEILVCHGERANLTEVYTPQHMQWFIQNHPNADMSKPAMFYITKDGQYAVDADFVSAAQVQGNFDLTNKPKIELK